jgi:phosphopantothenoylcysteine decarboxylase/phosphopantothenate--cysteine ligase
MDGVLWPDLSAKRVLLAVTGGIAAYKSAELCRLLIRCGAEVRVMMTAAAMRFVGELTFAALSGNPVSSDLFDPGQEAQIGHIELADQADLLLVAPVTANTLARFARGIADDLVSTVYLAYRGPVLLAPAMNVKMWEHPATRENMQVLRGRAEHRVVGPEAGEMACGHVGAGRMAEPEEVLLAAGACLAPQDLAGWRVLVSAGPTHEPLDPVRFLGNRSSGKMGYALAVEAAARGARVALVSGPTPLAAPPGLEFTRVTTARGMAGAIQKLAPEQDAVIMAAAVADYRPQQQSPTKLKKTQLGERMTLELLRTEDILASLCELNPRPLLVGFAAETSDDLDQVAADKMQSKRVDLLVANDVSNEQAGFEVDDNEVVIYDRHGGRRALSLMPKRKVAGVILDMMLGMRRKGDGPLG